METRLKFELPPPPNTASNLEWVDECILRYDEQIGLLEAQRQLYVQMRDDMMGGGRARARGNSAPRPAQGGTPDDIDLTGLTVDLEGAATNSERVLRVVEAAPPDRLLNGTQVGRVLQRSGAMTKIQSLRVAAQRVFERRPDLFEPVPGRPATYRYLGGVQSTGADGGQNQPGLGLGDPDNSNQEE